MFRAVLPVAPLLLLLAATAAVASVVLWKSMRRLERTLRVDPAATVQVTHSSFGLTRS